MLPTPAVMVGSSFGGAGGGAQAGAGGSTKEGNGGAQTAPVLSLQDKLLEKLAMLACNSSFSSYDSAFGQNYQQCQERTLLTYRILFSDPAVTRTVADEILCQEQYVFYSRYRVAKKDLPACQKGSLLGANAPCSVNEQCDSHVCVLSKDAKAGHVCGTCSVPPTEPASSPLKKSGEACSSAESPCERDLWCDENSEAQQNKKYACDNACTNAYIACIPGVGRRCIDALQACQSVCHAQEGVCLPRPKAGELCAEGRFCALPAVCTFKTCTEPVISDVRFERNEREPCGGLDLCRQGLSCISGLCIKPEPGPVTTPSPPGPVEDGAPCTPGGTFCLFPSACVNNVCLVPSDGPTCKGP